MITPRTDQNAGYYYSHGIKKNSDLVIDPSGPFVLADFARELERENARLRAIFPRILEALQSGACAPDCSVEFLEMIPNEVAGVMRKLRMPNPMMSREDRRTETRQHDQ